MKDTSFMKNIKTVIFDMDGIIFDSESAYIDCCKDIAESWGISFRHDVALKCLGTTNEKTKELIREAYGEAFDVAAFWDASFKLFMERYDKGRLPMKEGVKEILQYLKDNGIGIALASSTEEWAVRQELSDALIIDYFDEIVCGNMVERSKPHPDIFLKAAELMKTEPADCMVIEDSFNGIRAAHAAGMHPVMVPDILQPDDEIRDLSDTVERSLSDVVALMIQNRE